MSLGLGLGAQEGADLLPALPMTVRKGSRKREQEEGGEAQAMPWLRLRSPLPTCEKAT